MRWSKLSGPERAQVRGVGRGDVGGDEGRVWIHLAQQCEVIVGRALVRVSKFLPTLMPRCRGSGERRMFSVRASTPSLLNPAGG